MKQLKELRLSLNKTKEEMAKELGYSLSMYEKVEDGRAQASANFMKAFKKIYPNKNIDEYFFQN